MNDLLKFKIKRIENEIAELNRKVSLPYGYVEHEVPFIMQKIEGMILELDDMSHAFRLHTLLWKETKQC